MGILRTIKGYLLIPVWIILFIGSSILIMVLWVIGYFRKGQAKPYFKPRPIFTDK